MKPTPALYTLPKNPGKSGHLSFLEEAGELPMEIKRVYWIYDTQENSERGNHYHENSDRTVICASGTVEATIENTEGEKFTYNLDEPCKALYFPKLHWVNLKLSKGAIVVVLASALFKEDKVVSDYEQFKRLSRHSVA